MVELEHGPIPVELATFCAVNPNAPVTYFEDGAFQAAKVAAKAELHRIQGGLCVYCEKQLTPTGGQLEHIKPKGGPDAQPTLCFVYSNFAHSCNHIRGETCGQKKGHELLLIEPGPGCNAEWTLSTEGTIEPIPELQKDRQKVVEATLAALGLNNDSDLVDERDRWFKAARTVLRESPEEFASFLLSHPYRYIIAASV